jgi:hypothetical protein
MVHQAVGKVKRNLGLLLNAEVCFKDKCDSSLNELGRQLGDCHKGLLVRRSGVS